DFADYVATQRGTAMMLASLPGLLDLPPEALQATLRTARSSRGSVTAISMIDATGATVARSDDAPLVSVAASPRFQEAARSKTTTVSVAISVALQRPLLFVNAPILGPGGAFAGVVSVAVEPEQIAMALARSTEPGEQAYIVDQTGRVMVPPDPGRM